MTELIRECDYKISDEVNLNYSDPGADWPFTIKSRKDSVRLTPVEAKNLMEALRHFFHADIRINLGRTSSEGEKN